MIALRQPPDSLLRGRRALDSLPFCELVADWSWGKEVKKWILQCRVVARAGDLVPATTTWFILADPDYPWGDIDLYPAKEGGLVQTFQHQSHNDPGPAETPWRKGKICVRTSLRYLDRVGYDVEPFSVDDRLSWHVRRAREWLLEAAETGRTAERGDPFELPDFPGTTTSVSIGFLEDQASFEFWQAQRVSFGFAEVYAEASGQWAVVASYSDPNGKVIRACGFDLRQMKGSQAIWLRLFSVPVLKPWQAPATFGELRVALGEQGIDLNEIFAKLAPRIRDGRSHYLLLGFPIPDRIDGENSVYQWQGLLMPTLTRGAVKGFRPTEPNHALNDMRKVLGGSVRISWITSRNWAEEQIRTRGRGNLVLRDARVLLVGGGAIGSAIAELLVRQGCKKLSLIDGENLEIGNLCRHTLSLEEVGKNKADSLALRLNTLSPHARISSIPRLFGEMGNDESTAEVASHDVILDCTGSDQVAYRLSTFPWGGSKLFFSVSIGFKARRLLLFVAKGGIFPFHDFVKAIRPWLVADQKEYQGEELPRESAGCWNPIFPARADDIWLMSSIASKWIDEIVANPPVSPHLQVYEQNGLAGVEMVGGT